MMFRPSIPPGVSLAHDVDETALDISRSWTIPEAIMACARGSYATMLGLRERLEEKRKPS